MVDTYSATDQAKAVVFAATGLASGPHTLTIDVTGTKNASAQGLWIWIDAFDTTSGATTPGGGSTGTFTRVEQTASAVAYTGSWYANNGSFNSGGSSATAMDAGRRVTFTFTGTAAKWIGYKDPWSGIANVYVDGVLKAAVDTYSADSQAQAVLYSITGLSSMSHTVTIEVTGTRSASAKGLWIWVDAFEYMP